MKIIIPVFALTVLIILFVMFREASRLLLRFYAHRTSDTGENDGKSAVIALISDLHISCNPVQSSEIINAVNYSDPDCIVFAGDFVNRFRDLDRAVKYIRDISEHTRKPLYFVLGNHDEESVSAASSSDTGNVSGNMREKFISRFESLPNVRFIENTPTNIPGTEVSICGLRDFRSAVSEADSGNIPREIPDFLEKWISGASSQNFKTVLVTHNADILTVLSDCTVKPDLTLCGHTHAGQIRMPFGLEFKALRHDKLPRRGIYYGAHNFEGYNLYITSGLGCSLAPLRFGTNPEVAIISIS